jgi:DNA modification methylase
MPESVTDRCTKAHEYVFLLSKSERYYYGFDAMQEPAAEVSKARMKRGVSGSHKNINGAPGQTAHSMSKPRERGSITAAPETRNRRSVWTITTKPYSGAHFAVMPADLVKPCIMAGCREGGVVLDPFSGSGTTAMVARDLSCRYVGIELNPEYVEISLKRLEQGVLF